MSVTSSHAVDAAAIGLPVKPKLFRQSHGTEKTILLSEYPGQPYPAEFLRRFSADGVNEVDVLVRADSECGT